MSRGPWKEVSGRRIAGRVKAVDVEGDKVLFTIKSCFLQRYGDRDVNLCIEVAEFPGKVIQCNKTQAASIQALVGHKLLPDSWNETLEEFEGWEGLALPMVKRVNEYVDRSTGEVTEGEKLYAVPPSQYDKAVSTFPTIGKAEKPRRTGNRNAKAGAKK